eukprot:TRINITY_DN3978_c0_g1_i1.p1 TRINITY_DN3978_c0_g1~~TRINITY_DN3978_c0_g1_i1.p1  ORF type:complete len:309 (-),score=54.48 TRINITY_DN3978_c0_g1_i1:20-817(-)
MGGAAITIITFSLFKDLRTYPIKLMVYLCFCILFAQLFFLTAFYSYDSFFCLPSAILTHFFFLADFAWSFCVAFNFYQMIVRRNREAEKFERYYHIFGWSIPLLICVGVAAGQRYADLGGVCYINSELAIFLGFFIPGLIVISANCVIFFFIAREIHDTLASAPQAENKREKTKEFRVYVSIFISIGLPWIFGFLMTLFEPASIPRLIFLTLYSITTPLQGFLIFGSYCLNAKVFGKWAGLLGKCFPCFKQWEHLGSSKSTGSRV